MTVKIRFAPGLKPVVVKHAMHDQSTHGSWATGVTATREGLVRQASKFETYEQFHLAVSLEGLRPKSWHIADEGFKLDPNRQPTDRIGSKTQESGLFLGDPEYWQEYATGRETVIEYDVSGMTWTKYPQSEAGAKADFFSDKSGNPGFFVRSQGFGRLKETARLTLAEAIRRSRKQQDEMPNSRAETKQIWDESRLVAKHADHDQQSHGNWAGNNFKENTNLGRLSQSFQEQGLGNAVDKYSATFGIDKDENYFGTNAFEANAVLSYAGAGYEDINYFARGLNRGALFITEHEAFDTVHGNPKFFDEAMENYGPLLSESDSERTLEQESEAIYSYATSSKGSIKLLEAFREGKSPRGDTANRNINLLDKVIANSPDIFGGTTLYRVFSNKVLENLKEGDILRDKGFMSTTRANITEPDNSNLRFTLGGIKPSPDTVGVIRPSPSKKGKGLAVDLYKTIVNEPMGPSLEEKEVLLPRNTSLRFLGYGTGNATTGTQIAIFERVD